MNQKPKKMKVKNKPFQMNADEITMLAMASLRGKRKLNDTNVDCFVAGYDACMNGFRKLENILPLLASHLKKQSLVEDEIKMRIGYADLRRGYTKEEQAKIDRSNEIIGALNNLIEVIQKGFDDEND